MPQVIIEVDNEEIEIEQCPACEGPCFELGALGNRVHYRCQNCGADHSHTK